MLMRMCYKLAALKTLFTWKEKFRIQINGLTDSTRCVCAIFSYSFNILIDVEKKILFEYYTANIFTFQYHVFPLHIFVGIQKLFSAKNKRNCYGVTPRTQCQYSIHYA